MNPPKCCTIESVKGNGVIQMTAQEQQLVENLQRTIEFQAHQLDSLLKLNAQLTGQLATQSEQLATQSEQLATQSEQIKVLLQKIEELTGGPKDSHNSSKPPSSDGYRKKPAPKSLRESSEKKQGGQPGHKGSGMKIERLPEETVQHYPSACISCPHREECQARIVEKRYEYDIVVRSKLVEHQQMECCCPIQDQAVLQGKFPDHIKATKQYGLNITAFASALSTVGMVGIDRIHQLLQSVFQVPISTGTIRNMLDRLTEATKEAVAAIREQVQKLPYLHLDETGLRVAGSLHWLHCACNEKWSFFALHKKRGSEGMDEIGILPDYDKLVIHDCWASYEKYQKSRHALCCAHILRELVYMNEQLGQAWAGDMKCLLQEILHQRHELESAGITAFTNEELDGYSSRYDAIVQAGIESNPLPTQESGKRGRPKRGKTRSLLDRLQGKKDQILRFAWDWTVPFSNNEAERSIRFSKVKQKVSGCFRTLSGAEDYASIMSFISTASKHGVNYFDAVKAALNGDALQLVEQWA